MVTFFFFSSGRKTLPSDLPLVEKEAAAQTEHAEFIVITAQIACNVMVWYLSVVW